MVSGQFRLGNLNQEINTSQEGGPSFHRLPSSQWEEIRRQAGTQSLHELLSLSRETDPELFAEGLFSFAQRAQQRREYTLSALCFSALTTLAASTPLATRAQENLEVLQGGGPLGLKLEFLGRELARQSTNPALWIGMGVAAGAFQTFRLAAYSRLLASPSVGFFTRGLGARALSWTAGFAVEFPTFTLATRGIHELMGVRQEWSGSAIGRDLLNNGLSLFALKTSSLLATRALGSGFRMASAAGLSPGFFREGLPHLASFVGLMGAHSLEVLMGMRPSHGALHAVADSLAMLVQFQVGGRILHGMTGGVFSSRMRQLETEISRGPHLKPPSEGATLWQDLRERFGIPTLESRAWATPEGYRAADFIFAMVKAKEGGSSPQDRIPEAFRSLPFPLFDRMRNRYGAIQADIQFILNEQGGEPLWLHQSHRLAAELKAMVDFTYRELSRETPPSVSLTPLKEIGEMVGNIEQLLHMVRLGDATSVQDSSIKIFLGHLYRCPNQLVNFLNSSDGGSLHGAHLAATHAWAKIQKIFPGVLPSPSSSTPGGASPLREDFRLGFDPDRPGEERVPPPYDFQDISAEETTSRFALDIRTPNRKIVLLGSVPPNRIGLSMSHDLEIFSSQFSSLRFETQELEIPYHPERITYHLHPWEGEHRQADYLEAYEIFSGRQLTAKSGPDLAQSLLALLKPGGVGYVVSRADKPLEQFVEIITRQGLADILHASKNALPPVVSSWSTSRSSNYVFFRKLPY